MTTTPTPRRLGLLALAALAAGLATGCGPAAATATGSDPATSPPAADVLANVGEAAPAPAPGPSDLTPSYPGTTETYSKAVVSAWTQDQPATLGSLTTTATRDQILDLLPTVNANWSYLRCDGTAGSSYCSFTNADGDLLTLRISHALLGKAHAAIEVSLDVTEYPADGVAYVKEFVAAWQFGNPARMLKLSGPAVMAKVKTQVKAPPASPTYPAPTCCGGGGLLQVKVVWSGVTGRFDVGTTMLGGPNAIVDYAPGQLPLTS
jgi:hypothetical protein